MSEQKDCKVNVRLTESEREFCKVLGGGTVSAGLRKCVEICAGRDRDTAKLEQRLNERFDHVQQSVVEKVHKMLVRQTKLLIKELKSA